MKKKSFLQNFHTLPALGKKPSKVDQDFQKRAEFLLHDELSAALDIPFDEVGDYITQQVEQMKQTG